MLSIKNDINLLTNKFNTLIIDNKNNNSINKITNKYWNIIKRNIKKIINYDKQINNKFIFIIETLNKNRKIMLECYYEILVISITYPPQKNENKFIYGKLIELSIINCFTKIGFKTNCLDDECLIGSQYKNDIKLLSIDISIKAKLNKNGNIILINKLNTYKHIININTLLCVINERKMYFIPSNIVNNDLYITENAGCISYKYSLITMIDKKYKEYIYIFPELTNLYKEKLNNIIPINIYYKLYNELKVIDTINL